MNVNAKLVQKVSKSGNDYVCIEIEISKDYKKIVFLDKAEIELIKLSYNQNNAGK